VSPGPLEGVRVVELASFVFVPMAGAILAEWGADVIKVEDPETGDPMRALKVTGQAGSKVVPAANFQLMNRGKRSVGISAGSPEGREVLYRLVESADVFTTNLLPSSRRKLEIDVEHIRRRNPQIVYAKGSGLGFTGAEHARRGFDFATYWSRGGIAASFHEANPSPEYPPRQVGAFGDFPAGAVLASGIAAALAGRALTGDPSVVDVSLLSLAAWQVSAGLVGADGRRRRLILETEDGRYLALVLPTDDDGVARVCADIGAASAAELEVAVSRRPLEEWRSVLRDVGWVWEPVQTVDQLTEDPQLLANEYVRPLEGADGMYAISGPVQFGGQPPVLTAGPKEAGSETDEVLLELGYTWDELIELKINGSIL
jgi:crotonobetainyl-CoA:carnitine CoA-transferase CaiB-like acyl-CoA transferase